MYDKKSKKHQLLLLLAIPVSAGGYHQHKMNEIANGLNSFMMSNGSFLTIILYVIPAATIIENSAANAIHIWRIHQLSQAGLTIGNERIVRWCNITDLQSIRNESRFRIGSLFFPKLADCLPTFVSFLSLAVLSLYRKLNTW